jgi:twinkle protein
MAVADGLSLLPSENNLRNIPSISLPNGCHSFPPELLQLLEPFKRIYLWLDDDKPGHDGCEKFATKLGKHRCWIIRPSQDTKVSFD